MSRRRLTCVLALAAAAAGCRGRPDEPSVADVSVQLLAQDSAGAHVRVCNNGFQPIRRVDFTVGGVPLSADTLLDQAHCAELTRGFPAAPPATMDVVVTRVEGR
jgi:hypothetical protein